MTKRLRGGDDQKVGERREREREREREKNQLDGRERERERERDLHGGEADT